MGGANERKSKKISTKKRQQHHCRLNSRRIRRVDGVGAPPTPPMKAFLLWTYSMVVVLLLYHHKTSTSTTATRSTLMFHVQAFSSSTSSSLSTTFVTPFPSSSRRTTTTSTSRRRPFQRNDNNGLFLTPPPDRIKTRSPQSFLLPPSSASPSQSATTTTPTTTTSRKTMLYDKLSSSFTETSDVDNEIVISMNNLANEKEEAAEKQVTATATATTTTSMSATSEFHSSNVDVDEDQDQDHVDLQQKQQDKQMELASTSSFSNFDSFNAFLTKTVFLGIEPTPDVVAIATIYFVEGALGLARLAQTYLLKDELHLGPAELSALSGIFVLPWSIKPIYGFLSDGVPLFGYRRRSYLILCGLLGFVSYTALGQNFWNLLDSGTASGDSLLIPATVTSLMISSACIAFSDVVADGIVVQKTRTSQDPAVAGGLQSLCWSSAALGGLLSAYFSGSLLEYMKPQDVFGITAILPFLVATIALLIDEQPINTRQNKHDHETPPNVVVSGAADASTTNGGGTSPTTVTPNFSAVAIPATNNVIEDNTVVQQQPFDTIQDQIAALWEAIKQPSIYKPALFLFLWQSTPTSDGAFFFFLTDELGFGPEFLGRVRLITSAASLVGVWLYNQYLKTIPIKQILFWSSIISVPLGMTSLLLITHTNRVLGIPDEVFVLGDDVVLAVLGEIAFMPTLVLAAKLCPPGVEAVLFATLMSMYNFSGTLGTEIGALLTKLLRVDPQNNFQNLGLLTIICNLSSLYPLLFIGFLDEFEPNDHVRSGDDEED